MEKKIEPEVLVADRVEKGRSAPYRNLGRNIWGDVAPGVKWILKAVAALLVLVLLSSLWNASRGGGESFPQEVVHSPVENSKGLIPGNGGTQIDPVTGTVYSPEKLAYDITVDWFYTTITPDMGPGFCRAVLQDTSYDFEGLAHLIRVTYGRNPHTQDVKDTLQFLCLGS